MSESTSIPERSDALFGEALDRAFKANRREQDSRDPHDYQLLIAEKIQVWGDNVSISAGGAGFSITRTEESQNARAGQAFIVREGDGRAVIELRFVGPNLSSIKE